MDEAVEVSAYLRLSLRFPGAGMAVQVLLEKYDNDAVAVLTDPQCPPAVADEDALVQAALAWQQPHRVLLTISDPRYPPMLRHLPDPPLLLYVLGDVTALSAPQLAIVGSRQPTAGGRDNATAFASHLAAQGWLITSGMALGIDAAAHEGALQAGARTVAVTGTGIDRVYPAQHRALAHRIAEQGCLISELPLGAPPLKSHFPRRNRLIAALSQGTLVVEAALGSGSLITAQAALELGREVFAMPGSIHNPLARGCHQLIRQGAKLVETASDVSEELASLIAVTDNAGQVPLFPAFSPDADHLRLLEAMGFDPAHTDTLIARSGFSAAAVAGMLLTLELNGVIELTPAGYLRRQ